MSRERGSVFHYLLLVSSLAILAWVIIQVVNTSNCSISASADSVHVLNLPPGEDFVHYGPGGLFITRNRINPCLFTFWYENGGSLKIYMQVKQN